MFCINKAEKEKKKHFNHLISAESALPRLDWGLPRKQQASTRHLQAFLLLHIGTQKRNFISRIKIFQVNNAGTWGLHNNFCFQTDRGASAGKGKKDKFLQRNFSREIYAFLSWNLWLKSIKIFSLNIPTSYKSSERCIIMLTFSFSTGATSRVEIEIYRAVIVEIRRKRKKIIFNVGYLCIMKIYANWNWSLEYIEGLSTIYFALKSFVTSWPCQLSIAWTHVANRERTAVHDWEHKVSFKAQHNCFWL